MPPPDDGNEPLPFVDLMKLKRIDDVTYQSIALPFSPGGVTPGALRRSFGGHVYAQASWTACQTVEKGLLLYNVVGTFLLGGINTIPFVYKVHKIRDGRSFSTRIVNVTQGESSDICFSSLISFKTAETSKVDLQENLDLWEEYKVALTGKRPRDFPPCPGMDVPWYWKYREETGNNDEFPGLESTKVDLDEYNKDRNPLDRKCLLFYRTLGPMPADPNLHLCAHLYASDRNSLYIVTNLMDMGDLFTQMSSLIHTTVFHGPIECLMFGPSTANAFPMDDTKGDGRWFGKEDWTTQSSNGRAMFHGRLWAPDGTQVATLMQDGMIRYTKKPEATAVELAVIEQRRKNWKRREKL